MVKHLPAMQETQAQSLGWEGPPKKGMATHSSILAWRIPWTEEPVGYSPRGRKELDRTEQLTLHYYFCHEHMKMLKYLNEICFQKMMFKC